MNLYFKKCTIIVLFLITLFSSFVYADKYNHSVVISDISAIRQALDLYKKENGTYPSSSDGLEQLTSYYLNSVPIDPWVRNYKYLYPPMYGSNDYDLYSFGKDGLDDNGGGDDISNWKGYDRFIYRTDEEVFALKIYSILGSFVIIVFFLFFKIVKKNKASSYSRRRK